MAQEKKLREKKFARELIQMAEKEFQDRTINGAIQYVYNMAFEKKVWWARSEVLDAAEIAIDQARAAWAAATESPRSFNTGQAEIEAARSDGFDLLGSAFKLLPD